MKNEVMEDKLGVIFVESIELYQVLIQAALSEGHDIEKCDNAIKKIIPMFFEREPGLYDYALENVPLAQSEGVYEWAYNSVAMYKQPVLDHFKKKGIKSGN